MSLSGAVITKLSSSFTLVLLLYLFIVSSAIQVTAVTPIIDSEEELMLDLINDYRAKKGLSRLKISIKLTHAAEWMSGDMAAKNYFSHVDSLRRDPFVRMTYFKYNYSGYRGENLAAGFADAVNTFNQWKQSPSHNSAMLNSKFNVIGISRVYRESSIYKWYWTTDFGSHVDATFDGLLALRKFVNTGIANSYSQTKTQVTLTATCDACADIGDINKSDLAKRDNGTNRKAVEFNAFSNFPSFRLLRFPLSSDSSAGRD